MKDQQCNFCACEIKEPAPICPKCYEYLERDFYDRGSAITAREDYIKKLSSRIKGFKKRIAELEGRQ